MGLVSTVGSKIGGGGEVLNILKIGSRIILSNPKDRTLKLTS